MARPHRFLDGGEQSPARTTAVLIRSQRDQAQVATATKVSPGPRFPQLHTGKAQKRSRPVLSVGTRHPQLFAGRHRAVVLGQLRKLTRQALGARPIALQERQPCHHLRQLVQGGNIVGIGAAHDDRALARDHDRPLGRMWIAVGSGGQ